jgi:N-dimethylarginine dimethylaminohydrolase
VRLSEEQRRILQAMRDGAMLKAHRTVDGEKVHRLHPLEGLPEAVDSRDVESLKRRGLIVSNMKFPAAMYLLTEAATDTNG